MRIPALPARVAAASALIVLRAPRPARAFLGIGDTSFVTVIANPAEAANWAAELDSLNNQLQAARGTLQTVGELRAYAGDPKAAVAALRDLSGITAALGTLSSGSQTEADLAAAWQAIGSARRLADALCAPPGGRSRHDRCRCLARRCRAILRSIRRSRRSANSSSQIRSQVAGEQAARASVAAELAQAWSQFRSATTESGKQAILSEISQLQSQNQVMDARRRALLDDLALSDRQDRDDTAVRDRAADEQMLAESAQLNANTEARARTAEAQRLATLQKSPPAPPAPDYSGLRTWTTADAGGTAR